MVNSTSDILLEIKKNNYGLEQLKISETAVGLENFNISSSTRTVPCMVSRRKYLQRTAYSHTVSSMDMLAQHIHKVNSPYGKLRSGDNF